MAIEFYSSIDLNKNELQNAVIQVLSTKPSSPVVGQIFFDSDVTQVQVYNGSAWQGLATEVVDTDDIFNAGLRIGRDSHNMFDFETADNTIDIYLNNAKDFTFTANTFTAQSGSTIAGQAITGTTIDASTDFTIGNLVITDNTLTGTALSLAAGSGEIDLTTSGAVDINSGAFTVDGAAISVDGNDDSNITITGSGKDLTLAVAGGSTQKLILSSAGTSEAIDIDATAGGIDVTSLKQLALETSGAAGDILIKSAHTAGRAVFIDANANAGSIVDIDAGILDIDVTAGTTIDTTSLTLTGAGGMIVKDTTATSADRGANLTLQTDDGAAMADNHRLGGIFFRGAEDASNTLTTGATIAAFCDADWSDTENGTRLVFSTTDANASTSAALTLDSDQKASFAADVAIAGNLVVTGTTTTNIVETVTTSSGVVFEGTAADGHDATLLSVVASSDKTYTLPNVTGHVALFAADPSTTTISSTPAELNKLDGATVVVSEINMLDLGSTAVGNAIASKAVVLDSNKDYDGIRNFTISGELDAGSLDISGDADIDGTLETDALTIGGAAVLAQATASAVGAVELATAAEVITGTDTARVVTADTLSAKSVVADIDVSSLTDANIVTITHNLGTADIIVQVYDKTTEANIMCDIARTTDDFSTASTSVVSIDFGTAPPNDCRALITSLAGATASGTVAYT